MEAESLMLLRRQKGGMTHRDSIFLSRRVLGSRRRPAGVPVYRGGICRGRRPLRRHIQPQKLWEQLHGSCGKPYNYYPRGRVDADNKGQPVIYMSPHVPLSLLLEIQTAFAITTEPLLRYDNSRHYRCHLDDGWGGKG